jgi:hypothetical protein
VKVHENKLIENAGVNAAKAFFEAQRCVFQSVALENDYGKDAYGDHTDDGEVSQCVAVQHVQRGDRGLPPPPRSSTSLELQRHQRESIQVRAVDDVAVTRVGILVLAQDGTVVEEGLMTQANNDKTRWTSVATWSAPTPHVQIIVDATDLASQVTRKTEEKTV